VSLFGKRRASSMTTLLGIKAKPQFATPSLLRVRYGATMKPVGTYAGKGAPSCRAHRDAADLWAGQLRAEARPKSVILRSDLLGGCAVAAFVFGIGWICVRMRFPLWFARTLLVVVPLVVGYFVAESVVPEYNKPWGVWVITLGLPLGPVAIGWPLLAEEYQNHERSRGLDQQRSKRERRGGDGDGE